MNSRAEKMLYAFQEELSNVVTSRRNQHCLSQADLAELANVPVDFIEQIESITGLPSLSSLLRILRPLELTLSIISIPNGTQASQSFSVDDIRRIREEADIRYQGMTPEEISKEISKGAQEGHRIIERIKREKEARHND